MRKTPYRKLTAGLAVLVLLASTGAAVARPSTLNMNCRQAQSLVAQSGAIVMSTGPHTYDRFVAYPGYCMAAEYAYVGTAPTRDSGACQVGYVCRHAPPLFHDHRGEGLLFDR